MRRLQAWVIGSLAGIGLGAAVAQAPTPTAEEIVLGLSRDEVAITATFDGSDILIFGAVKRDAPQVAGPPLEVVISVSGPLQPLVVRHAERRLGIWVNTSRLVVNAAPSFYAVATSTTLAQSLSDTEDLRHSVSVPRAISAIGNEVGNREDYLDALIRIREGDGRYLALEGSVAFVDQTLFSTEITLPSNLIEGDYATRIFLTREGVVVDEFETSIFVRRVGIERWLHVLSGEQPLAYGLLSLAIAILAGWIASRVFQAMRP